MAVIIQIRNDVASKWTSVNPILAEGEVGIEMDTNKFKIGDGTKHWADLPYFTPGEIGDLSSLTTTQKDNIVAAINELNSDKQENITGGASTITSSNLTANRALISNSSGKVAVSSVTNTELGYLSGTTSAVQTQLNGKASTSLDNLSANGQMIIDSQNGTISNCILEIPQDIKLELNNGTLTLKSGSIITSASGTQYQATADITYTPPTSHTSRQDFVFGMYNYINNTISMLAMPVANVKSGPEASRQQTDPVYFATDTLKFYYYGTENAGFCLTIALITLDANGVAQSIDQVFNGAGYIGHHAFVLPGVKGLIQNGLNDDGSLKSGNSSNSSLRIQELSSYDSGIYNSAVAVGTNGATDRWFGYYEVETREDVQTKIQSISNYTYIRFYIKEENRIIFYSGTSWDIAGYMPIVFYKYNGTSVTQFDIRQPVHLATTEMVNNYLSTLTGYDATATQTLKNINGVLTWVTD